MTKDFVKNVLFIICLSLAFVLAVYMVNHVYLFPYFRHTWSNLGPDGVLFVEGLVSVLMGVLASLGSGGWGILTQKAAMLAAWLKLLPSDKIIGPGEVYRRDKWKPGGSTVLALSLMIAGAAFLLMSFGHYY